MSPETSRNGGTRLAGALAVVAVVGFLVHMATAVLEPQGRDFAVLAVLRLVFARALFALGRSGLLRWGVLLTGFAAVANALGAAGAILTDGWWFNPFEDSAAGAAPPWYAYVIGASAMLFALGSVLAGVGAWRAGLKGPGLAAILGGVLYGTAWVLPEIGHGLWALPWLALGVWLWRRSG